MEEVVKDALISNESDDLVLRNLLEMTIDEIQSERRLFSNALEEPAFYRRRFRRWVQEGLEEVVRFRDMDEKRGAL